VHGRRGKAAWEADASPREGRDGQQERCSFRGAERPIRDAGLHGMARSVQVFDRKLRG
jgi:hypothetical protein